MSNGAERMRRELMIRIVRDFKDGKLADTIDRIPIALRPKTEKSSRCCIYHDRAVLKYRLMGLLGFSSEEETDELRSLKSYLQEAIDNKDKKEVKQPLSVCGSACSSCPESRYYVTPTCRGCFARPCVFNCPKGAISVINQQSHIDYSKCIKCGKCQQVCPFNAIIKTTVPCEEACPVGAIRKNELGVAEIDFKHCIFCGKCFSKCPFSAVMERSQLIPILQSIKEGREIVAMVAPSALMQFPGTVEQLFSAIHQAGFTDVMEVALGAELTTEHEAAEFAEKMIAGQKIMTTSCCTAYVELVKRHIPEFFDKVSTTPSPMKFAARLVREKRPNALTVFIGPCIAKRWEAENAPEVDYVMTFEELGAMLAGLGIDIMKQEPWNIEKPADQASRNYAKSCGVTEAVIQEMSKKNPDLAKMNFKLDNKFINGIDKKTAKLLKLYAMGKMPGNFLEVMSCGGGCIGGPCSLIK